MVYAFCPYKFLVSKNFGIPKARSTEYNKNPVGLSIPIYVRMNCFTTGNVSGSTSVNEFGTGWNQANVTTFPVVGRKEDSLASIWLEGFFEVFSWHDVEGVWLFISINSIQSNVEPEKLDVLVKTNGKLWHTVYSKPPDIYM